MLPSYVHTSKQSRLLQRYIWWGQMSFGLTEFLGENSDNLHLCYSIDGPLQFDYRYTRQGQMYFGLAEFLCENGNDLSICNPFICFFIGRKCCSKFLRHPLGTNCHSSVGRVSKTSLHCGSYIMYSLLGYHACSLLVIN